MTTGKTCRFRRPRSAIAMVIMTVVALPAHLFMPTPGFAESPATKYPYSLREYRPQFTRDGVKTCLYCHDVERMRVIATTPHGDSKNPDTPFAQHGCESCHGPGSLHATRSRMGRGRPPMIAFGPDATTPASKQVRTCLENCHIKPMGKHEGMQWKGSAHDSIWKDAEGREHTITCMDCHELHVQKQPMEDKEQQASTCYKCHPKAEAEHPRFEDKGIAFDKLSCWDCHDVHQLIRSEHEADHIPFAPH
jgi:DmsE family decaheme c-type cytochrome